jgi:hypothetical protein
VTACPPCGAAMAMAVGAAPSGVPASISQAIADSIRNARERLSLRTEQVMGADYPRQQASSTLEPSPVRHPYT